MKKGNIWKHPKMRFWIAVGAITGIGHAIFRGAMESMEPIHALLITLLACGSLAFGLASLLNVLFGENDAAGDP